MGLSAAATAACADADALHGAGINGAPGYLHVACVVGATALVWFVPDLVWLNIAAQVLNAFLLPLVIGLLVALAVKALPEPLRLRGFYLWVLIGISAIVIAVALFGGVSGLL